MKGRHHSSALYVILAFHQNNIWRSTLLQSMKGRNHSSALNVILAFQQNIIWIYTLHQSMKRRNHSSALNVILAFQQDKIWIDIFLQSMNGRRETVKMFNSWCYVFTSQKRFKCFKVDKGDELWPTEYLMVNWENEQFLQKTWIFHYLMIIPFHFKALFVILFAKYLYHIKSWDPGLFIFLQKTSFLLKANL